MDKRSGQQFGYCKLCRKNNQELHKDSHIFPAFMIRNSKGLSSAQKKPLFVGLDRNLDLTELTGYNYSGEFEQYIFCKTCEGLLSKLDDYGAKLLTNKYKKRLTRENRIGPNGETYFYFTGFDYAKYKLFVLSLFVRASISERPDLNFKLKQVHEENISDMIVNGTPGSALEYGFSKYFLTKPVGIDRNRLYYPRSVNERSHVFFFSNNTIDGVLYALHTEFIESENDLIANILNTDGSMSVMIVNDFEAGAFYLDFLRTDLKEYFSDNPNVNFVGIGFRPTGDQLSQMIKNGPTQFNKLVRPNPLDKSKRED